MLESLKHGVAQTHGLEPASGLLNTLSNQSILQKHSSVNMTRQYQYRRLDWLLSYPFNLGSSKAIQPDRPLQRTRFCT